MQIRLMTRDDFEQVTQLGKLFAKETGLIPWNSRDIDDVHVHRQLYRAMTAGLSLVAESAQGIEGIFLSVKDTDMWIPSIIRLKEMAWWIQPELRGTNVGVLLLDSYIERAEAMRERGEIMTYSIGHYVYSPEIAKKLILAKGFKFLESNYVVGEY